MKKLVFCALIFFAGQVFAESKMDPDYVCDLETKNCQDGDLLFFRRQPLKVLDHCVLDSIKVIEYTGEPLIFCRYRKNVRKIRR